jgi:hypothetical protein
VGFNSRTFNSTSLADWHPFRFFGSTQSGDYAVQEGDGSIFLNGTGSSNSFGGTLSTAEPGSGAQGWTGLAFGGGAYFEATLSFTGQGNGPYGNGGPDFWANDIEHMSGGPYNTSFPGDQQPWNGSATYSQYDVVTYGGYYWQSHINGNTGHAPTLPPGPYGDGYWDPYQSWVEVDFMEYDCAEFWYQNGIGNWYTHFGSTSNPYQGFPGSAGSVPVPNGTDLSKPHTYGALWVPATPTTKGYLKFYFDGVQTASPTFYWNYWDAASPPPPLPVNGSTAMSVMDQRHMAMILGTGTNQPMTVYSVQVWQASSGENITQ